MKIGYDAAFARGSPGQLLMLHTIGHAASQGLASYEMLGNTSAWTAEWTRTLRPFVAVQAYPASWAGAGALCTDAWRAAQARWQARAGSRPGQDVAA
jgi:CelD/BcsL family acetyltransferase involved in cellulose biosynthesis